MNKWILALPLLIFTSVARPACGIAAPLAPEQTQLAGTASAVKEDYANLKSVTLQMSGGFSGIVSTLDIRSGLVTLKRANPPADRKADFSTDEQNELIEVLREAAFAKLVGEYEDKRQDNGLREVLTVVVGTDKEEKTYTVKNRGTTAPPAYYVVKRYLTRLQLAKFSKPETAPAKPATDAAQPGTHDFADLTSRTFQVTGGFAGVNELLTLNEGRATFTKNRPQTATEVVFTQDDMKQLVAVLNEANFGMLVGNYHQKNLSDGFGETITAIVGAGKDRKAYIVSNYGMDAPPAFYKVTAYLRELQRTKLAPAK